MSATKIEWATDTINPLTGCTPISEGCANCYAQRMARRLAGRCGYPADEPFRPATWHLDRFKEIERAPAGKRVFVGSMGDVFHDAVDIHGVAMGGLLAAISRSKATCLLLTKRPRRMAAAMRYHFGRRPPENLWLGVTAENQDRAAERFPVLREISAAVRFVSLEPLLGQLPDLELRGIGWVIVGGETGPRARPMHPDWVRSLRDQCQAAGVPFFFKGWGEYVGGHATEIFNGRPGWCRFHNEDFSPSWDHKFDAETVAKRVGKAHAGRLLDGRTWEEVPA